MKLSVSLETLYREFKGNLKFGKIEKYSDNDITYYDLYSNGTLVCMDGEVCEIAKHDDYVELKNTYGEYDSSFKLTHDEYSRICF